MLTQIRRQCYGQVTHIDYQLGRFLGELKQLGLYMESLCCRRWQAHAHTSEGLFDE